MRRLAVVTATFATLVLPPPALGWTWPTAGDVLKPFAFGGDPYAGGQHRGIDVGGEKGSAVLAPSSGVVAFAGSVGANGKVVTIETDDGHSVTLVQLGSLSVAKGESLREGAAVGTIGPSGTPEHDVPYVHLGIRITSDPQGYLDPLTLLPPRAAPAPPPQPSPAPPPAVELAPPPPVHTAPPPAPAPGPQPAETQPVEPQPAEPAAQLVADAPQAPVEPAPALETPVAERPIGDAAITTPVRVTVAPRSVRAAPRLNRRELAQPRVWLPGHEGRGTPQPVPLARMGAFAAEPSAGARAYETTPPTLTPRLGGTAPGDVLARGEPVAATPSARSASDVSEGVVWPFAVLLGIGLAGATGVALRCARRRAGGRRTPPTLSPHAVLSDDAHLLRQRDPAHRTRVHDDRRRHPRAAPSPAG